MIIDVGNSLWSSPQWQRVKDFRDGPRAGLPIPCAAPQLNNLRVPMTPAPPVMKYPPHSTVHYRKFHTRDISSRASVTRPQRDKLADSLASFQAQFGITRRSKVKKTKR